MSNSQLPTRQELQGRLQAHKAKQHHQLISSVSVNVDDNWKSLANGQSVIVSLEGYDTDVISDVIHELRYNNPDYMFLFTGDPDRPASYDDALKIQIKPEGESGNQ